MLPLNEAYKGEAVTRGAAFDVSMPDNKQDSDETKQSLTIEEVNSICDFFVNGNQQEIENLLQNLLSSFKSFDDDTVDMISASSIASSLSNMIGGSLQEQICALLTEMLDRGGVILDSVVLSGVIDVIHDIHEKYNFSGLENYFPLLRRLMCHPFTGLLFYSSGIFDSFPVFIRESEHPSTVTQVASLFHMMIMTLPAHMATLHESKKSLQTFKDRIEPFRQIYFSNQVERGFYRPDKMDFICKNNLKLTEYGLVFEITNGLFNSGHEDNYRVSLEILSYFQVKSPSIAEYILEHSDFIHYFSVISEIQHENLQTILLNFLIGLTAGIDALNASTSFVFSSYALDIFSEVAETGLSSRFNSPATSTLILQCVALFINLVTVSPECSSLITQKSYMALLKSLARDGTYTIRSDIVWLLFTIASNGYPHIIDRDVMELSVNFLNSQSPVLAGHILNSITDMIENDSSLKEELINTFSNAGGVDELDNLLDLDKEEFQHLLETVDTFYDTYISEVTVLLNLSGPGSDSGSDFYK